MLVLDYLLKHVELWPSCFFSVCSLGAELPARPARDEFERTAVFPLLRSQGYVAQWHLSFLAVPPFSQLCRWRFCIRRKIFSLTHTHTQIISVPSFSTAQRRFQSSVAGGKVSKTFLTLGKDRTFKVSSPRQGIRFISSSIAHPPNHP